MRRPLTFDCAGATLAGTLDEAPGSVGLLLVTGGTQVRIGAHRGMAALAQAVGAAGFPAFRFDRRGVGDSEGEDPRFAGSAPDLAAAAQAFRRHAPHVRRIAGFGLCDGATALAFGHAEAELDALILANPWTIEPQAGLPPPAAIRRRYAQRLFSPSAWVKLLTGGIDYRAAAKGLKSISSAQVAPLADAMAGALDGTDLPVDIVLATGDATAIAFDDAFKGRGFARLRQCATTTRIDSSSHSFARDDEPQRLAALCIAALRRLEAKGG